MALLFKIVYRILFLFQDLDHEGEAQEYRVLTLRRAGLVSGFIASQGRGRYRLNELGDGKGVQTGTRFEVGT